MTNSRIKELAPGVTAEAIATDIHLRYNPATGAIQADFHFQDFVTVNGQCVDFANGKYDFLPAGIDTLATKQFGTGLVDPVTGLLLDHVSGAGIVLLIKAAADALHNERAAIMAQPTE